MVSHHVKEGIVAGELAGAEDGVAIALRRRLRDEVRGGRVPPSGVGVASLVAGPHDHADLLDVRREGLLDLDGEYGPVLPVAID